MSDSNLQLLSNAIGQKAPAVIAVGQGVVRRELLVKFVTAVYDPEVTGYWAQVYEGDSELIDKLIEAAEPVMVGTQSGGAKIYFESVILGKRRQGLMQRQILLRLPEDASVMEQRSAPREWVPERMRLTAHLQVLGGDGRVTGNFAATLWDLGRDGASVVVGGERMLKKLKANAALKLQIERPDPQLHLTFTAKHRHMDSISDQRIRLGIQFVHSGDLSKHDQEQFANLLDELRKEGIRDSMGSLTHPTLERKRLRRSA
jgi:hypothetical protein